jgi:hypothetical protein
MTLAGLPHSGISGSTLACSSPELIAADHALLRLLVPRHPPCALSSLTIESPNRLSGRGQRQTHHCVTLPLGSELPRRFAIRTVESPSSSINLSKNRPFRRSLKTEQQDEKERVLCRFPEGSRSLSRKEVIQPQVPLRLPCYDFTPVTSHSLGASLPCGLV